MKRIYTHRAANERFKPIRAPFPESEPLYAAKGDDDLMSQEPRSKSSIEQLSSRWEQNINHAKTMWLKLTRDELMQSEGNELKLTNLIARRYNLSTASAEQQVHRFFQQLSH